MKSVKLLVTGMVFLCLNHHSFSQTETDTTFATQMNTIFANLDKSKVPYGILRDYGMEFTDLDVFNGNASLVDSNHTDATSFWEVYNTLLMSRIDSSATGFLHPDTIESRWYSYRQPGRITLAGLFFNYSRFKDDASPNYITITDNQVYDKYVSGVWQNPYQNEKAFLLSPSVTEYQGKSFDLLLPTEVWFTNSSSAISSISVDLNDGNGYRTITPGTALSVSYTDSGYKEWTYKLTLTNSTYLYAHSYVHILDGINGSARFRNTPQQLLQLQFIMEFTVRQW